MTNDGWGKSWTTQQAVDKAIEKLNVNEHGEYLKINLAETVKEKAKQDITNPGEGWTKDSWVKDKFIYGWDLGKPVQSQLPTIDVRDFGIKDIAISAAIAVDRELEFLLARDVKLHLDSKIFTTDGLQVGDLVIWDDGEFFCISHVPTLSKFMKAVPTEDDKEYTNDQLVSWCVKVQQAYQEDWAKMRLLTNDNYTTKDVQATLAAQRLRDWCLSIPIE